MVWVEDLRARCRSASHGALGKTWAFVPLLRKLLCRYHRRCVFHLADGWCGAGGCDATWTAQPPPLLMQKTGAAQGWWPLPPLTAFSDWASRQEEKHVGEKCERLGTMESYGEY